MAHYAQLDSENRVVFVFVGRDEDDLADGVTDWEEYYAPEGFTVKRTSYNTRNGVHYDMGTGEPTDDQLKAFRGNFAGVGMIYNPEIDGFIPPQPFPSWSLNANTYSWDAPIPMPEDGALYRWDEKAGAWVEIPEG